MAAKSKAGAQTGVQVFVRARPFNAREAAEGERGAARALQIMGTSCRMLNPKKDMEAAREEFLFDHCFDSAAGGQGQGQGAAQSDVYARIGPQLLESCFAGYNACLFAYGQTGSGKTYTMMGDIETAEEQGVIPRLVTDLFERLEEQQAQKSARTFRLEASYLEVYCERVKDLLGREGGDLQVRSTPEKGVFVEGLTTHALTCAKDVYKLLAQGQRNRATACTNLNAHSSRSHALLTLNYTETVFASRGDQKIQTRSRRSRMSLVDLAGSERVKVSGVTGAHLEEAKKINLSLTSLGRIIDLLADRKPGRPCVLPVRESMLTWLLGDSLGGNSKTIMLAAVSPSAASYDETLSTLRYAARTKCIINETSVNETVDLKQLEELRGQIDELQGVLSRQSALADQLQTTEEKMLALQRLLEEERLAKERSDQMQRERAEVERRALEVKLQLERDQRERYLGQERQQLQDQLQAAEQEVGRLGAQAQAAEALAVEAVQRAVSQGQRDLQACRALSAAELQRLQEQCDVTARRLGEAEEAAVVQYQERASLQAAVEELQRRMADMRQEALDKEQQYREGEGRAQAQIQQLEATLREREMDWAQGREAMLAQHEVQMAQLRRGTTARVTEVTEGHHHERAELQRQGEERFKALKAELQQQFQADLCRLQQQHDATLTAQQQQGEAERRRLRLQQENSMEELSALRAAHKRLEAEAEWLRQQLGAAQEEVGTAKAQHEAQWAQSRARHAELLDHAKQQYEGECQRILQQQQEAVKEAHRRRDVAIAEVRKKMGEDMDRMRRAHEEKVARLKAAHDEALTTLQGQADATWELQRQEHVQALASRTAHHALEREDWERRLADAEARLRAKHCDATAAEAAAAVMVQELEEKGQAMERRHREEMSALARKLATLHRLLEQQLEVSRHAEDHLRTAQRRMEGARAWAAKEAQTCRLPPEHKWLLHTPKSPPCEGGRSPLQGSPVPRRGLTSPPSHSGAKAAPAASPTDPRAPIHPPLDTPWTDPARRLLSPKSGPVDEDYALEPIGSFNAGDTLGGAHPDHFGLNEDEALALF